MSTNNPNSLPEPIPNLPVADQPLAEVIKMPLARDAAASEAAVAETATTDAVSPAPSANPAFSSSAPAVAPVRVPAPTAAEVPVVEGPPAVAAPAAKVPAPQAKVDEPEVDEPEVDEPDEAQAAMGHSAAADTEAGTASSTPDVALDQLFAADLKDFAPEAGSSSLLAPGRELTRRHATDGESTGRMTLIRASVTAAIGGGIIALVSMAFGPRFFVADIRILGMFVGLAILALAAVAPIGPESRKAATGALIIVAAIVAFPIAAGGYFIGSLTAVVGGAMLVAYQPPTGESIVVLTRGGRVRRLVGLLVDFVAAFVLQRVLYALIPVFFVRTLNVIVAWVFCWLVVAIVPVIWTRRTAGRVLMMLRVSSLTNGERPAVGNAVMREVMRGLVAVGGFIGVAQFALRNGLGLGTMGICVAVLAVVGFIVEKPSLLDLLTGTSSAAESVIPVEDVEAEIADGSTATDEASPAS